MVKTGTFWKTPSQNPFWEPNSEPFCTAKPIATHFRNFCGADCRWQKCTNSSFPILWRSAPVNGVDLHSELLLSIRKLEKAVAVRDSLLEEFSGKYFDAAGKLFGDFPAARFMLSLPGFGRFPARKMAAGKLAAPAGTLLDFLLRDRHTAFLSSSFLLSELQDARRMLHPLCLRKEGLFQVVPVDRRLLHLKFWKPFEYV